MYTLHAFIASCLSVVASGSVVFHRAGWSPPLTTLLGQTIPSDTTNAWFYGNAITYVPGNYFISLPFLDYLHLDDNHISSMADYSFVGVPSVTWLNLGYNRLTVIREKHFAGLWNLRSLILGTNLIHTVQDHSFKDNLALVGLSLNDNVLQTLKQSVYDRENQLDILNMGVYNNPLECQSLCWLKRDQQGSWIALGSTPSIVCAGAGPLAGKKWESLTEFNICTGRCASICLTVTVTVTH